MDKGIDCARASMYRTWRAWRWWWWFLILVLVAAIVAVIILIVHRWKGSHKSDHCSPSCPSSSSSMGPCGCTAVIDPLTDGPFFRARYATFGSADADRTRHCAGQRRDPTLAASSADGFGALATGASLNWSGYATVHAFGVTGAGTVSQVVGTWTVPTVTGPSSTGATYSATWIGIDGLNTPTVEQLGTAQDWVNGEPVYYGWYQMAPTAPVEIIGLPVAPGNTMSASVTYLGDGVFRMGMKNVTQHVTVLVPTSDTTNVNALRTSAEWIMEAPSDGMTVLPLADASTVTWSGCCATVDGVAGSICAPNRSDLQITMLNATGTGISTPSALSNACTAFTVSQP